MKILIVLTYYRPHISGLTIYAEFLAKALVKRGHEVTVLSSRHEKNLPLQEMVEGVRIVRAPVLMKISKGTIMPTFGALAAQLIQAHDIVHVHLPQFDSAIVTGIAKLQKKPVVITYHCDLLMPPGLIPWLANQTVLIMNHLAAIFSNLIITYTQDYADHSEFLRAYRKKLKIILPPVDLPVVSDGEILEYKQRTNPGGKHPVIGMAVRFATEKGVEVILDALPKILTRFPETQVQFSGPYKNIRGEEHYINRLMPRIRAYQKTGNWLFLGPQSHREMALFYPNIDVLILPSLNSTEAFGLVQIESMISGSPSVASALPGVRQPVMRHQMGKVVPIGDSNALAEALLEIFENPEKFRKDPEEIRKQYLPDTIAQAFEQIFEDLV
ncbi:MAG: glycosyltransferase family 1 protein [Chloroflexi bacterium HGW-Chloroflexi-10]|nr:MAG: glycosyltransferase family 1 protein [Chloroflexi bacterium HGW-Chloroflexi-10]